MRKIVIVILAVLLVLFVYFSVRENVLGNVILEKVTREKVVFKGFDGKDIYGLFIYPRNKKGVVIVLPGAEGTKESREFYAEIFLEKDVGALILDQRGIGETDGRVNSFVDDFYAYIRGEIPDQMIMARDVSSAVDYLRSRGVDEIAVLGESMGGRYAIIAASYDKRIKGVIVVSSAGYGGSTGNEFTQGYIDYINPNSYVDKIAPRRLLMLHSVNDNVISIREARETFNLAGENKELIEFSEDECVHGYCEPMRKVILEELEKIFG